MRGNMITHKLISRNTAALGCIAVRVLYTRAGCPGLEQSIVLALCGLAVCSSLNARRRAPTSFPEIVLRLAPDNRKVRNRIYVEGRESSKSEFRNHRKADVRPRTFSHDH
jgi:hypothetical protein